MADITYIRLPTAFVYLACVLDAFSRRCIGWKLSRQIDTQLTLAALDMAVAQRQPAPELIHHSDRGVQYANAAYVARLEQIGAQMSMSAVGNPYDNAKAESFFKTLKHEEVYLNEYRAFAEAEAHISQFIEAVYNAKRLHSSLGYRPPVEFEACYSTPQMAEMTLPLVRYNGFSPIWRQVDSDLPRLRSSIGARESAPGNSRLHPQDVGDICVSCMICSYLHEFKFDLSSQVGETWPLQESAHEHRIPAHANRGDGRVPGRQSIT